MAKQPLVGSERQPLPGATSVGKADPGERLEVTMLVRRRAADKLKARIGQMAAGGVRRRAWRGSR